MTFPHPMARLAWAPEPWSRTHWYSTSWFDPDRPDRRFCARAPQGAFDKESPGKDGTGEFPEDGLQCV